MPSRNIVRIYDANTYYHIYNRGVEKRKIFLDDQDYAVFLSLLKRHLGIEPSVGSQGREYEWLSNVVEVTAFCLMPNHFHLLLYQIELDAVTKLVRAVCSAYVVYFNDKYDRVGPLFQGKFRAVRVSNSGYLQYLTRYIHRNPSDYMKWEWSSLSYWLDKKSSVWVTPQRLNDMSLDKYLDYLKDDNGYKSSLGEISDIIF